MIAKKLVINIPTVKRFGKKIQLRQEPRKTRIRTVATPTNINKVSRLLHGNPSMSLRKTASILNGRGINISQSTVRKCAKLADLVKKKIPRYIRLTDQAKAKRVSYAQKHLFDDWKRFLFIDESYVELTAAPNQRNDGVYLKHDE